MKKGLVCSILLAALLGGCVVVPAGPGYGRYHHYDGPGHYRGYGPGYERGYDRGYRGW